MNKKTTEKVTLSPPWRIYYRKVKELFGRDEEIEIFFDEDNQEIKICVDNASKAAAIESIMPDMAKFGDVIIEISIIPGNNAKVTRLITGVGDEFDVAFDGNPVYCYTKVYEGIFDKPLIYVVFKKEVVQFYTDNLGDVNGLQSTLYQDIARDVLAPTDVFYCTDNNTDKWFINNTKSITLC